MSQQRSDGAAPTPNDRELMRAFEGLVAHRNQVDTRETRATAMATDLIADLARAMADQPDIVLTDAVCERLEPCSPMTSNRRWMCGSTRIAWPRPRWWRPRLQSRRR